MLDKRALMRDQRIAHQGISRRIRLRARVTGSTPVASVDPLADAAAAPGTDTLTYIAGEFYLIKTTQDYDVAGAIQRERGAVYCHPMYKAAIEKSYSMYIGGTGKEWKRISLPVFDDARMALKVIVEASQ
jgi:hypothetical protein